MPITPSMQSIGWGQELGRGKLTIRGGETLKPSRPVKTQWTLTAVYCCLWYGIQFLIHLRPPSHTPHHTLPVKVLTQLINYNLIANSNTFYSQPVTILPANYYSQPVSAPAIFAASLHISQSLPMILSVAYLMKTFVVKMLYNYQLYSVTWNDGSSLLMINSSSYEPLPDLYSCTRIRLSWKYSHFAWPGI